MKDPYRVLGVPPSASQHQIRKAYRRKVRRYHPDVNHEPNALERFQAVQRAYETLNDPRKRAEHDRHRAVPGGVGAAGRPTVTVSMAQPRVEDYWPGDRPKRRVRGESSLAGAAQVLLVIANMILAGALVHQIAAAAQLQQRLTAIEVDREGAGAESAEGGRLNAGPEAESGRGAEPGNRADRAESISSSDASRPRSGGEAAP